MDILEFAMQMELDGKAFYEKHAKSTSMKELKEILLTLAEEEEKHYQFFKKMKEGKTDLTVKDFSYQSKSLAQVKNIFVDMANNNDNSVVKDSEKDVWEEALKIEEKAVAFYSEKAISETDTERKNLLLAIAEEEKRHVHMIDSVLTFLKFPDTFADTAQFKNFQSLEGH